MIKPFGTMTNNPQLNKSGQLQHLLTTEGLPAPILLNILDTAESFVGVTERDVKKVPILRGKSVFNLFFEPSTRTRTTFEIAAKRLSADVVNLNIAASSQSKGETLLDTVNNLSAMHADMFVVRHSQSGAAHLIARHVKPEIHVINAGDGRHAHPTQGLLDVFTIRHYKTRFPQSTRGHSRRYPAFARCALADSCVDNAWCAGSAGHRRRKPYCPPRLNASACTCYHQMAEGLKDVDVLLMLRLQNERMVSARLPSKEEYFKYYGLTQEKLALAKPDAIVLHPGPMNRGVEIDSAVADGKQSVILPQVTFGIAVRMAVMSILAGH